MFAKLSDYVTEGFSTCVRKGALMSKADVRRTYVVMLISPLLAIIAVILAFEKSAEGSWFEYFCWALAGIAIANCFLMPALLYGYHRRDQIETGGEDAFDFGPAARGALVGAAAVPLVKLLSDWLGGG